METKENILRVQQIRVINLFWKYTHEVKLRNKDRVTIIHGPNGVGKTVFFRLISTVLSGNLSELIKTPFEVFEIKISDGTVVGFSRKKDQDNKSEDTHFILKSYLKRPGEKDLEVEIKGNPTDIRRWALRIENEAPWLNRTGKDSFMDRRTDEVLSSGEIVSRYSELLPGKLKRGIFPTAPDWMSEFKSRVSVHLIETQRLLRFRRDVNPRRVWEASRSLESYTATVNSYAKDLQGRISENLAKYAKESQALDQSFPQRLLKSSVRTLAPSELQNRMQKLETKRNQLKRIGLLDEDPSYPIDLKTLENLDATHRTVMDLYIQDTERKLGALDELAQRIEILLETINKKFRHKEILIDREKGFVAQTDGGELLDLESLSSGEQHELVLLYDLLFRVKPNTLVLIDEPELSLHVTWQKAFLPDLLEIVAAAEFDVILATHSPFIVGDRADLMVPLSTDGINEKAELG